MSDCLAKKNQVETLTKLANLVFPYFLILTIGTLCYAPSLNGSFTFDDYPSIVENESIRDLSDLRNLWQNSTTRFVAYFTFALNFYFHELNVTGFRLVNLIIHLLSGAAVFWMVRLLFAAPEIKGSSLAPQEKEVALAASLLFISHPVEVQAVSYVVQRLASLMTLFYILSLVFFVKARLNCHAGRARHTLLYSVSFVSALMAMFTKEPAFTLPLCLIVIEFFFFSPSIRKTARHLERIWPMFLTLPVIPITYLLTRQKDIERLGLATQADTISRSDYLLTQFNVIRTYLRLILFPVKQSVDYDYPISHHFFEPSTFASFLLLCLVLVLAIILFRKFRLISFGIIWFFLTLMVESSVIPIEDVIFEHRLYLPSVGIILSFTCLIFTLMPHKPKALFALFTFIICMASLVTINRNVTWREQIFVWNQAVANAPNKFRAYLNRGVAYEAMNRYELAMQDYALAMQLKKSHPYPYLNRGVIFFSQGDYESAVSEFNIALGLKPDNPRAYLDRGLAYLASGKKEKAYQDFRTAAGLKPKDPFYLNALGVICNRTGRFDLAMLAFTRAIALNDKFATPYFNRAKTKLFTGSFNAAIKDLDHACELALDIPELYHNRALAHVGLCQYRSAIKDFTRAISRDPGYAETYSNRGMAYHRLGLERRALMDLDRAIELSPHLAQLYRNRAKIYRAMGREEEARMDSERADALKGSEKAESPD